MTEVKFYDKVDDELLRFAVIAARMSGKWILCKHKEKTTYEFPGGRREKGESIFKTAERELKEETGTVDFTLRHICYYSILGKTREGENLDDKIFGALFYAEIKSVSGNLQYEIEKIVFADDLPDNLTYPTIAPKLFEKVRTTITKRSRI